MDCCLLLFQEIEEVLDGTSFSSLRKIPQIAAISQYYWYWWLFWRDQVLSEEYDE